MMKKTILFILSIFIINSCVVFFVCPAFAEKAVSETAAEVKTAEPFTLDDIKSEPVPEFDLQKSFIRMMISLSIILVLIFSLMIAYKKFFPTGMPTQKGKGLIRVIEKFQIEPRHYLILLWVIDRMVLVSSYNGAIQKISEIKDGAVTREIHQDIFQDSLQREMTENPIEENAHV